VIERYLNSSKYVLHGCSSNSSFPAVESIAAEALRNGAAAEEMLEAQERTMLAESDFMSELHRRDFHDLGGRHEKTMTASTTK